MTTTYAVKAADGESTAARRAPRRRRMSWRFLFLAPAAIYVVLIFAYPIGYNLWLSFRDYDLKSLVSGASQFVGLRNFSDALQSGDFMHALLNTVAFTAISIAAQFVIGLALAMFFFQKFPLSQTMRAALILPWLIPGIVATTAWRWLFADNGLINEGLAAVHLPTVAWLTSTGGALPAVIIVNVWIGISFNLVLIHSGLQGIPNERFEAAQLDGANYWQRFIFVVLPGIRPVVGVLLALGFVYTLKQFDLVWTLTGGGPGNASQLLSTWSYTLSFSNNSFGAGAAVSDILFVISLAIIVVYSLWNRRK